MRVFEQGIQRFARHGLGWMCAALLVSVPFGLALEAQDTVPAPPPVAAQAAPLPPQQLDDLVAPVALYPDALLSQVLVASTYPLEIVEASQFLQQNQGLQGQALMDAARAQNWDPSVQALVAMPEVLNRLSSNISWTTALGNAFLAQQADVMSAVQRMRARAQANGRLSSDAQQTVTTQTQNGETAIDIAPANPQVIYVPEYNPEYIWGPPVWGAYPPLYYPTVGFGFGFYPGIYLDAYFGGWGGWGFGGWGWGPNWFAGNIFINTGFFNRYGFHSFYGGYGRGGIWAHNPYHRLGVAYPNQALGRRFGGNYVGRNGAFHAGAGIGAQRAAGFAGSQYRGGQSFARSTGGYQRFGSGNAMGAGRQGFAGNSGGYQRFGGAAGQSRMASPQGRTFGRGSSQGFAGSPAYRQAPNAGGGFRSSPSYGGGRSFSGGSRPSFGGGGAPRSFGGGAPRSFGGGGASRSFGGGGSHSFGGGGGSRSFGGGGSHGGGGGHGGRR
jgi:hypothetical protein